jgi:hypothetical protein
MADADDRVERSLYNRAIGYSYDAVKIFCSRDGEIIEAPYVEHVPPDVTACIFWLKNRRPQDWRDVSGISAASATLAWRRLAAGSMTKEAALPAR